MEKGEGQLLLRSPFTILERGDGRSCLVQLRERGKKYKRERGRRSGFPFAVPHKSRMFGCFRDYSHGITINTVKMDAK